MDETDSLRLIADVSESDSEEDGGNMQRVLGLTSKSGTNGILAKNRRHTKSQTRTARTSCITAIFSISLLANVVLLILLLIPKAKLNIWETLPCSTAQTSSNKTPSASTTASELATAATQDHFDIPMSGGTFTILNSEKNAGADGIKQTADASNVDSVDSLPPAQTTCPPPNVDLCREEHPNLERYRDAAAKYDNIFEDLSLSEIQAVYNFLLGQSELRIRPHDVADGSHVYAVELHTPNKTDAIEYLEGRGSKPAREARIVLERPYMEEPVVEEYVVGPLPTPTYYYANPRREKRSIPISYFPTYGIREAYTALRDAMIWELNRIFLESYGASTTHCGTRCLMFLPQRTSSAYTDNVVIVLTAYYATDFVTINPVDFMVVMKETKTGSRKFEVDSVFYAGKTYNSMNELVIAYRSPTSPKTKITFPQPTEQETSNPGTMNLRGRKFPVMSQAGPKEFEPEGKRYSVTGQHIRYLEWSFNLRMSTASGPQLWDVRWAGERIAYEISLQDVAVIYAGANPNTFYAHLSDSAFGLGDQAYGLVPGADCPEHATFLPQTIYQADSNQAKTYPNAFCLFEHNTGVPLRRHRSNDGTNGKNYGGLLDRVLILRTIIVEYNYDYIFDVVFHQNGAVELKTYATGYIMSQHYYGGEAPFGFRVHENVVGSIHHHMMNFKIDLDIQGRKNRYETLDFVVDERTWPWHKGGAEKFQQIAFRHNLKRTEQEAILHYNFSKPKYHIAYNDEQKNKFGNHRAYRIATKGFSKQILPDDSPALKSRAWTKYQLLTTQRKDKEEHSSSIFSMFDGRNPHVDIERYLQDNETILDQDLVFWVTIGFHHIPHTEDIPNTPTVGAEAVVSLLPYNYFPECPSLGSRDAVRADVRNSRLVFEDYGTSKNSHCLPKSFDYSQLITNISQLYPH